MKFTVPFTGDYDPRKGEFTIAGRTVAGNRSSVTLPIASPPEGFVVWVAQCMGQHFDGGVGLVMDATSIALSMDHVADGLAALLVTVDIGGKPLSFALPVQNLTPEQTQSIGQALQGVTAMIEKAGNGQPSN